MREVCAACKLLEHCKGKVSYELNPSIFFLLMIKFKKLVTQVDKLKGEL